MDKPPDHREIDRQKWHAERGDRIAERAHDRHTADIRQAEKATVEGGNHALRTVLLINGGAAVSVLAFIGGLVGKSDFRGVAGSLMRFAIGVAVAAGAFAAAYFTSYCDEKRLHSFGFFYDEPHTRENEEASWWGSWAKVAHIMAMALGLFSLILFVIGMIDVRRSVEKLTTIPQSTLPPKA